MAGAEQDDPFDWDSERLANEFSSARLSSVLTPGRKLPDPASLVATIREIDMDGQTLLTYEDELGISGLFADLGIRKPPHKVSMNELIRYLKRHSPKYNAWKSGLDEPSQPTVEKAPMSNGAAVLSKVPDGKGPELAIDNKKSETMPKNSTNAAGPNGIEAILDKQAPVAATDMGAVLSRPPSSLLDMVLVEPRTVSPESEETDDPERQEKRQRRDEPDEPDVTRAPAPKKRKIAPMVISSSTLRQQPAFITTEADNLLLGTTGDILKRISGSSGYLGPHALRPDSITNPIFDPSVDNDEREFTWVHRGPRLAGRSVQVCGKMKRFLRDGPFTTDLNGSDTSDQALPVFGESDDEDELDSVTWEEIEKEEQERVKKMEREKAGKAGHLSEDEVREVIRQAIETLKAEWTENKKPQMDRSAYKKWRKAQSENNRHAKIRSQQKWLSNLEKRVDDMTAEIVKTRWTRSDGLEDKARSYLDASITDQMEAQWLIDVLQSPVPPAKPSKLPNPKPTPKPKPVDLGEDEEILTDDDFVVDDDDYDADPMDLVPSPFPEDQIAVSDDPDRAASPADEPDGAENSETPDQPPAMKLEKPSANTPRKAGPPAGITVIQDSPAKALKHVPDLLDIEAVAQIGAEHWANANDQERLIVAILFDRSPEWRARVFRLISDHEPDILWDNKVEPAILEAESALRNKAAPLVDPTIFDLVKLFNAFFAKTHTRMNKEQLLLITWQIIRGKRSQFPEFYDLVKMVMPKFLPPTSELAASASPELAEQNPIGATVDKSVSSSDENPESSSESSDNVMTFRKKKKKKRCDEKARDLQETTKLQAKEFDKRRELLQSRLAQTGSVPSDKSRLIVNLTKESDDQALIYINEDIGRKIKDHQVDGVRFLWNHLVLSNAHSGGGLLAHSMGLGKTMQVITLLVVIAESARSPDPSVRSQIPRELRKSKTLIICPAGLLENWVDEILSWAPPNLLGKLFKLSSSDLEEKLRPAMIREWASKGGLLVIGIELFTMIVGEGDEVAELLVNSPSIVVCDEAHMLKNPTSQRHKAAKEFKTKHRIALTGSPLTKDIQDYYYMINWIAPGYLADHAEFKQRFEDPIKLGLFADSEPAAKRRARKQLHVLKGLVEPKVHRRDTDILRAELPKKQEFILSLPLTQIQKRAYELYLDALDSPWGAKLSFRTQTGIWSLVANLTRLLAHPYVFKMHMEKKIAEKKAKQKIDPVDDIPEQSQSEIRALLRARDVEDLENSCKIVILLAILDECKRVRDKVLVFCQSIDTLNYLQAIFNRQKRLFQRLDGSTKVSDRQNAIRKFNTDSDIEVYLISTRAGGVGFNIYGANRVVIFDFRYTPSEEKQAIGRAYRIGQTKPVTVYWLTTGGTYEDAIRNTTVFKAQLASRIVDKKNPNPKSNRAHEFRKRPTIPDKKDVSNVRQLDKVLDVLLDKYADPDDDECLIRSVTRTETFEEEENFELTAEDQLEAEQDLETERLRVTNPEEYKRREQEKWAKLRAESGPPLAQLASPSTNSLPFPPHMRDQHHRVTPNSVAQLDGTISPGFAVVGDGDKHAEASTANETTAPETLPDIRPGRASLPATAVPSHVPVPKPSGSLVGPNRVFASKTPSSVPGSSKSPTLGFTRILPPQTNPVPSGASSIQTSAATKPLEPILGKHTHYKESPKNTAQPASRVPAPVREKEAQLLGSLTRRADELQQHGHKLSLTPAAVVMAVNSALNNRGINGLPRLDKLQNLIKYIQENSRFADGILSYHLPVRTMIDMDRAQLDKKSKEYLSMSQADFVAQVWKTQGNPDQSKGDKPSTPKLSTRSGSPIDSTKASSKVSPKPIKVKKEGRKPSTQQGTIQPSRPGDSADAPLTID